MKYIHTLIITDSTFTYLSSSFLSFSLFPSENSLSLALYRSRIPFLHEQVFKARGVRRKSSWFFRYVISISQKSFRCELWYSFFFFFYKDLRYPDSFFVTFYLKIIHRKRIQMFLFFCMRFRLGFLSPATLRWVSGDKTDMDGFLLL